MIQSDLVFPVALFDSKIICTMVHKSLGAPVFIHTQDNELLAFIDGEMHRADIG